MDYINTDELDEVEGYTNTDAIEEERPQSLHQRGTTGDLFSAFIEGTGDTISTIGKGIGSEGLEGVGDWVKGSEYARPDLDARLGLDSLGKRVATGISRNLPQMGYKAGAAVLGGALAGPAGATAGYLGARATYAKGNYENLKEEALAQGKSEAVAGSFATQGTLWEEGMETLGDLFLAGPIVRAMGKQSFKTFSKSLNKGDVPLDKVVMDIAGSRGLKRVAAESALTSQTEGLTEVATSIGQDLSRESAGMRTSGESLLETYLVGMGLGGTVGGSGNVVAEMNATKAGEQLMVQLNDINPEAKINRQLAAQVIYDTVVKVNPEQGQLFAEYADEKIRYNQPIKVTDTVSEIMDKASMGVQTQLRKFREREEKATELYNPNVPEVVLGGRSTNEVLGKELQSVEQWKEESRVQLDNQMRASELSRSELRGTAPGTRTATDVSPVSQEALTEGYTPDVPGEPVYEPTVPGKAKEVPEAKRTETYEEELKRVSNEPLDREMLRSASVAEGIPGIVTPDAYARIEDEFQRLGKDADVVVKNEEYLDPQDAYDRTIAYWTTGRTYKAPGTIKSPEPAENFSRVLDDPKVSGGIKDALIEEAGVIAKEENELANVPKGTTVTEIVQKQKSLKKRSAEVEAVIAEVAVEPKVEPEVEPKVEPAPLEKPQVTDEEIRAKAKAKVDKDIKERRAKIDAELDAQEAAVKEGHLTDPKDTTKNPNWKTLTYPNGYKITKISKSRYEVQAPGENAIYYKSITKAKADAQKGELEGRAADVKKGQRKSIAEKDVEERATAKVIPEEEKQAAEDWLIANKYLTWKTTLKEGVISASKVLVESKQKKGRAQKYGTGAISLATADMLQERPVAEWTKADFDKAIERTLRREAASDAKIKKTSMTSTVDGGEVMTEGADVAADVMGTAEDQVVPLDEGKARLFKRKSKLVDGKERYGPYTATLDGDRYRIDSRVREDGVVVADLTRNDELVSIFPSPEAAAESLRAGITLGDTLVLNPTDATTVEESVKLEDTKAPKTVLRRKKKGKISKEERAKKLASMEVTSKVKVGDEVLTISEPADEAIEILEERKGQLDQLYDCMRS